MLRVFDFTMLPDNEIVEVVAMDFKDACLTIEEEMPDFKPSNILLIEEHQAPIPGIDTIH